MDCEVIDWLPSGEMAMNRCKAAAAADVLLCPEDPELRQYRCGVAPFDAGIEFAHHHDGASSFVYVVRAGTSTAIKVIANRAWIGPDALARFQRAPTFEMSALATRALNEPELRYQELTGLFWCEDGGEWQGFKATIDGTSNLEICKPLLQLICVGPKAYYQFAQRYHEVTPDPSALKAIFTLTPMSQELVDSFTEECKLSSLAKDFAELGYPLA